jgi:hypothetical protein
MNTLSKVGIFLIVLGLGIIGAKLTYIAPKQDPNIVIIDRKQLYELTYEWAMYKEIAIIAYSKLHNCSKEEAKEHLETSVNKAVEKQFISWYENREKWEKK